MLRRVEWSEAERMAKVRLDRRMAYAVDSDGVLVTRVDCGSKPCAGCHETVDGYCMRGCPCRARCDGLAGKSGPCRGGGCEECGYTGRRRMIFWLAVLRSDAKPGSLDEHWDPGAVIGAGIGRASTG